MLKFARASSISFLLSPNANEILERFQNGKPDCHRNMRRIVFVNGRIPLGAPSEWRTGLRRRNSPGGKIIEHMFLRVVRLQGRCEVGRVCTPANALCVPKSANVLELGSQERHAAMWFGLLSPCWIDSHHQECVPPLVKNIFRLLSHESAPCLSSFSSAGVIVLNSRSTERKHFHTNLE